MNIFSKTTVGEYLIKRLEEIGLKHIFGVVGDYSLEIFHLLEKSSIKIINTCNELNAGYAADGYARTAGLSAVCVTYGVGGFSVYNAIAGSYAERLPVIVISGAPSLSSDHPSLLHHTVKEIEIQSEIYKKITEACVVLNNPETAPELIDSAIATCLKLKRPVYIELPKNIVNQPCKPYKKIIFNEQIQSNSNTLNEAVAEAAFLINQAQSPVVLAGIEVHRLDLVRELMDFIESNNLPFMTTLLNKSILPEDHPQFFGVYSGITSWPSAIEKMQSADMIICMGTLMTDIQLGQQSVLVDTNKTIVANAEKVKIKFHSYDQVSLKDFIPSLSSKIIVKEKETKQTFCPTPFDISKPFSPEKNARITTKRFFERINHYISKKHIVITDVGDSIFCSSDLLLPSNIIFLDQAFYLSTGFAIPATLGAKLASENHRILTIVGDGAFQMSAQELSTIARYNQNPIIFILDNGGYATDRIMVEGSFNDLYRWDYTKLVEVFKKGIGLLVETEEDLEKALKTAKDTPDELIIIQIKLDKNDCSDHLKKLGEEYKKKSPIQYI